MVRYCTDFPLPLIIASFSVVALWIINLSQATSINTDETIGYHVISTDNNLSFPIGNEVNSCECGKKSSQDVKIVGGTLSKQHAWPWIAAIVTTLKNSTRDIFCGSSIISNKYLLTAAHCTKKMQQDGLNQYTVILGTNNLNENGALEMKIASVLNHPKFNAKTLDNDVALVSLESRINFSQTMLPICITPQIGVPYVNKSAIVAGWGDTSYQGSSTSMQRQIDVVSNKICQARYKDETDPELKDITSNRICAIANNKDSCQGDSGSPLFLLKKGSADTYIQIGIVSTGKFCAYKNFPGIYLRLSRYTKWINRILRGSGDRSC